MKKLILILLLFCAKNLSAQQLYLGGSYGGSIYVFEQKPAGTGMFDLNWGLCTQYTFGKKSLFGYEGDLLCDMFGPQQSQTGPGIPDQVTPEPAPCFTAINYGFINPLFFSPYVSIQLKAGFFYSHYFTQYITPRNDYGPAAAIDLLLRLSKKSYWGFELSELFGLSKYYVWVPFNDPYTEFLANPDKYYNQLGYSNIFYSTFSLKFIYKIDNLHGK